jgi:glycosyltransferase involved in cell wall biosynthesis
MRRGASELDGTATDFAPMLTCEVEISEPLPTLRPGGGGSAPGPYGAALCLVRLHRTPLGSVQVDLPPEGLPPERLAGRIQAELGDRIDAHLRGDGLEPARPLNGAGLPAHPHPRCLAALDELRRQAPFASVVIPTRNRPASALETLRGVLSSDYPSDRFEVIVVDNGSGEDARLEESDLESGEVEVRLISEEAAGGSNARNAGLHAAKGEIVAFCDDDVLVDRGWLASLALALTSGERVGGAAGLTLPRELETTAQVWYEGFASADRGLERRLLDRREPPADRPLFPFTIGDLGSGENFAFRRDLLIELGGFDPALGTATATLGGEDVEAMLRVLLSDHQVVYEPGAIVRHAHQREFEQFERRVWGYGVGLTACLSKALIEHPRLGWELLRKLPRGLAYAISPRSAKNEGKPADYPTRLTLLELRGMAYGPLAYLRSRRRRGRGRHGEGSEASPGALRALIVTDSYWPLIGGANRSVELLAHNLVRRGHTVAIATAWQEGVPTVEDQGEVRVHRLRDLTSRMRWVSEDPYKHNPPPFPDPEAVWRLRRLIDRFEPDIVHAYGWLTHSTAVAMLGRKIPLLISARGYGNICAVHNLARHETTDVVICEGPAPLKCLACSSRTYGVAKGTAAVAGVFGSGPVLRSKTTAIHSVSSFVARKIDRYLRVEGARNEVIPNFHEDVSAQAVDEEIIARLPAQPFILYVGAFRKIKGIEELFEAYEQLADPPPLVLAGTRAPDTPERFPHGAVVVEDVPYPTVLAMWDRALFGVFPTKIPEALGNVVHEAMSKGRAVIGTVPGGHADMIDDGENGLLVPAGDSAALATAMSRLASDRALCERLGAAALLRASDFTPEVVMPEMEQLYHETVADFHRGRE